MGPVPPQRSTAGDRVGIKVSIIEGNHNEDAIGKGIALCVTRPQATRMQMTISDLRSFPPFLAWYMLPVPATGTCCYFHWTTPLPTTTSTRNSMAATALVSAAADPTMLRTPGFQNKIQDIDVLMYYHRPYKKEWGAERRVQGFRASG